MQESSPLAPSKARMVTSIGGAHSPVVERHAEGDQGDPFCADPTCWRFRRKTEPGGFMLLLDQAQTLAGPHCLSSPRPVSPSALARGPPVLCFLRPICPVGFSVGLQQVAARFCPPDVVFAYLLSKQDAVCSGYGHGPPGGPALGFVVSLLRSAALTLEEGLPCPVPQFPHL